MSGDIFGYHNQGVATGIQEVKARDAALHITISKTIPYSTELSSSKMSTVMKQRNPGLPGFYSFWLIIYFNRLSNGVFISHGNSKKGIILGNGRKVIVGGWEKNCFLFCFVFFPKLNTCFIKRVVCGTLLTLSFLLIQRTLRHIFPTLSL